MENINIDTRYNPPSKFNPSPYGELVKVIGETVNEITKYTYYIQVSEDAEKPNWIEIGDMLSIIYEPKFHDKIWLNDRLITYKYLESK